eukprot:PhM_4_TR365/c0_g1_i1/m.35370
MGHSHSTHSKGAPIDVPPVVARPHVAEMVPMASKILSPDAVSQLGRALLSEYNQRWALLYSSDLHGKSFNRFLAHVVRRGPTIVVIQEEGGNVFGGFAVSDWRTPSDRHDEARDERAAVARAERTGCATPELRSRPQNQHVAFYGDEGSLLFSVGRDEETGETDVRTYRARPQMNANYQYLFDTHALDDKIGVGMGGQVGHHGWFLDRWMDFGHCKGAICTTFGNPRLSKEESFRVECVEVWGVDPALAGGGCEVRDHRGSKVNDQDGKKHVLDDEDNADKAIIAMDGHQFYSDTV